MNNLMAELENKFKDASDEQYIAYTKKVIPGIDNHFGVRSPELKKITKWFLSQIELLNMTDDDKKYLAQGLLLRIEYEMKILGANVAVTTSTDSKDKLIEIIEMLIPAIDNWALCDSFSSLICSRVEKFKIDITDYLIAISNSNNPWAVRLSLVISLQIYCEASRFDFLKKLISNSSKWDEYYVKMGVAWLVSYMYLADKNKTLVILDEGIMSSWCRKKSIQKIIESLRVSNEEKMYLKTIR